MPRRVVTGILVLALASSVSRIQAQGPIDRSGVSVTATAEEKAMPNAVEMDVIVGHNDARASDGLAKCGEVMQRVLDACANLKLANLSIEERPIDVTAESFAMQSGIQMLSVPSGSVVAPVYPGGVALPSGSAIRFARTIRLTLRGIQEKSEPEVLTAIVKILDAVRDAGGIVGPPPREVGAPVSVSYPDDGSQKAICRFVLEDAAALQKKAVAAALAQAKAEASALVGDRVGALTAISTSNPAMNSWPVYVSACPSSDTKLRPTSPRFMAIPVRVTVHATFRIE